MIIEESIAICFRAPVFIIVFRHGIILGSHPSEKIGQPNTDRVHTRRILDEIGHGGLA